MDTERTLHLKEFSRTEIIDSMHVFLRHIAVVYSIASTKQELTELAFKEIKDEFCLYMNATILNKLQSLEKVIEIITTKIYDGENETILDLLSHALYRHYIEEKDSVALVTLGKTYFDSLNVSPAKTIEYAKKSFHLLNDLMNIKVYHDNKNVMLELSLKL